MYHFTEENIFSGALFIDRVVTNFKSVQKDTVKIVGFSYFNKNYNFLFKR